MGAPLAPQWITVLDAAKEWGVPPWSFAGGTPLLWFFRFRVYRRLTIEAQEKARAKK